MKIRAIPGCITVEDTMDEVLANLQDAIEGWLEASRRTIASGNY